MCYCLTISLVLYESLYISALPLILTKRGALRASITPSLVHYRSRMQSQSRTTAHLWSHSKIRPIARNKFKSEGTTNIGIYRPVHLSIRARLQIRTQTNRSTRFNLINFFIIISLGHSHLSSKLLIMAYRCVPTHHSVWRHLLCLDGRHRILPTNTG